MEVVVTKTFTKHYIKCPEHVKEAARNFIDSLEKAVAIRDINDIKKLSGFKNYYRYRIGQYRIGFKEEKPKVILMCILERSQIYKVFP